MEKGELMTSSRLLSINDQDFQGGYENIILRFAATLYKGASESKDMAMLIKQLITKLPQDDKIAQKARQYLAEHNHLDPTDCLKKEKS